ncbi:hypothetical protein GYMLUDRAFT_60733 [Collybiopsis luxurians FD-317 M1]|uniref:Unplaced genomic scaffold GYMLUscaffold_38, whole genome shotgun sequence n=1 Tax=Collybiopsis luxurians FD-317 M1 TaxID=944289 RepID=A0A0D0CIL0_9AGAR|nr:hypothetical protein GYMLUDRAFT_60733 [Collybiopsis luxurians FD-317 M1]
MPPAWFTQKIKKLEKEDHRKQLEIDELREQNQRYQVEVEKLRNLQTSTRGAADHVYDTISEAEVVQSAQLLNNSIQQAAALIADSCHFPSVEPTQDASSHETSHGGCLEHTSFLLSLHPKFGDFSTKFQNVLQHIIARHCFETIEPWTSGDDQGTVNCVLDRIFLLLKDSDEPPSMKKTWKRLTRSYGKMVLSPDHRLDWFHRALTGEIANALWIAGAVNDIEEGGKFVQEGVKDSLEQIFRRCLELEQAILGRQSGDVHPILPGLNSKFDNAQMYVLMEGPEDLTDNKVAFTCELGLAETVLHADGSSLLKVLLPAAVILQPCPVIERKTFATYRMLGFEYLLKMNA